MIRTAPAFYAYFVLQRILFRSECHYRVFLCGASGRNNSGNEGEKNTDDHEYHRHRQRQYGLQAQYSGYLVENKIYRDAQQSRNTNAYNARGKTF